MRYLFLSILLFLFQMSKGQNLKAKVVDQNDNPIEGVKVFFDKSTVASFTNKSGWFEIPKTDQVSTAYLIFYHPLFETLIESETNDLLPTYTLSQRADNLKIINYNSSPFSKEEMFSVFKRTLLGTTRNAGDSKIVNQEDISLKFDESNNTLVAKAAQPLYIINNALGYHIEYHLEEFEIQFSTQSLADEYIDFIYNSGYSYFKDVDPSKTNTRDKILQSSFRYFFKSLIEENYKALNYKIVVDGKKIKPKELFRIKKENDNFYRITFNSRIIENQDNEYFLAEIEFYQKNEVKILELFKPFLLVDKFGNIINSGDLKITDNVSNKRLADLLPINYN